MRYALAAVSGLVSHYFIQSFYRWDLYWPSQVGTWMPIERAGLLLLIGTAAGLAVGLLLLFDDLDASIY